MKYTPELILAAGLLICACSQPDPKMAELQRYYAQKGEGASPAVKRIGKSSPSQGAMRYLSSTNVSVPLSPMSTPTPLSTTNLPTPLSTTNLPVPLDTTNLPVP